MMTAELARRLRLMRQRVGRSESSPRLLYLEDSYTPTYLGSGTPGVTTYTFQGGAWVRKGNEITVRGQVAWSAATGTGNAQISLPFTPGTGNFTGSLYLTNVTFANNTPEMIVTAGNTFFTMGSPLTNANPTVVQVEAAGNIIWTVTYFL